MLWGWAFKAFKMSGNWGYLIKRSSGRQGDNILGGSVLTIKKKMQKLW